jgi:hypothetical protein
MATAKPALNQRFNMNNLHSTLAIQCQREREAAMILVKSVPVDRGGMA